MSQQVRILGAKIKGAPYLGITTIDDVAEDRWSNDPDTVMRWLWDGYRSRFNDRRALRKKSTYTPNPAFDASKKPSSANRKSLPVLDATGVRVLIPLGNTEGVDRLKSQFRKDFSHAVAIPDLMLQHADRAENTDWFTATKRRKTTGGAMPFFRSRKHEDARFAIMVGGPKAKCPQAQFLRTGKRTGVVTITGMNPTGKKAPGHGVRWKVQFRIRYSQPLSIYTSVQVNWSKKQLVFVSPVPVRTREATGPIVGLDVGVTRTIATSDGKFYDQPKTIELDAKIKRHQRSMARKRRINNPTNAKGWAPTRAYAHTREFMSMAHSKKKNRLNDWRHKTTTELVRTYDLIAFEQLDLKSMTKSAKGTVAKPGKNVAQKRGLNRSLAHSAFGILRSMIKYKSQAAGVIAVPVPPRHTSQKCSKCKNPPRKENRESQATFLCKDCGYTTNADLNASTNVLDLGLQRLPLGVNSDGPGHAPSGDMDDKTDPAAAVGDLGSPSTTSLKTNQQAA